MTSTIQQPKILVITGSTRPERVGKQVSDWFLHQTKNEDSLDFEHIDLKELGLPFLSEPLPARAVDGKYHHEHTQKWSQKVRDAAGFVIITPEYNSGYPAPLKNAIDHLYGEWAGKPVGLVGYGWQGGQRAIHQLTTVLAHLKMQPLDEQVHIMFRPDLIGQDQLLVDPKTNLQPYNDSAKALLSALRTAAHKIGG